MAGHLLNTTPHERGFTLVEAIVAGILSTIVVAVVITIIMVFGREVEEGAANAELIVRLEHVSEIIAREVRRGSKIVPIDGSHTTLGIETKEITIEDSDGEDLFSFLISEAKLSERDDTASINDSWSDLLFVPGKPITLNQDSSFFRVTPDCTAVTLDLRLTLEKGSTTYTLPFGGGTFRCRN